MRDNIALQRSLSLAEPIHRVIPVANILTLHIIFFFFFFGGGGGGGGGGDKTICFFFHFSTLRCFRLLKSFLFEMAQVFQILPQLGHSPV